MWEVVIVVPLLTLIAVIDIDVIVSFCSGFGGGVDLFFLLFMCYKGFKAKLNSSTQRSCSNLASAALEIVP